MAQSINLHPVKIRPTAVYGFGDSTIDSGWFKTEQSPGVYTGDAAYDALLAMALPANAGKPTTNPGPVSIEVLASYFSLSAKPANQSGPTMRLAVRAAWEAAKTIQNFFRMPFPP